MKYSIFFRDSTHILLTRDFISMMKEVPLYHQMNGGIHMNQLVTGKFIALKRKQKNLTQEQLAEKLGVSNKTISKWETGKCICNESDGTNAADEKWTKMINGMKIYTSKQLVAALKEAGFTEIKTYSNAKNHWISIVATK